MGPMGIVGGLGVRLQRLIFGETSGSSLVERSGPPAPDVDPAALGSTPVARQARAAAAERTVHSGGGKALGLRSPQMLAVRHGVPRELLRAQKEGHLTRIPEGVRLAPKFNERARQAAEYKASVREQGEMWKVGYGDYELDVLAAPPERRRDPFQLLGMERRLARQLEGMLERGRQGPDGAPRPVVAVDFGGMYGLTFLRLAAHFADRIDRGELVLAVSNLGFRLDDALGSVGKGLNELSKSEAEVIEAQRHRVHYLHADAEELLDAQVTLPNGEPLTLGGNVDVLHEDMAICHGHRNDVDLAFLGDALSDKGVCFLGSTSTHFGRGDEALRKEAHQRGMENLAARAPRVPVGRQKYAVFARDPREADVAPL